MAKRRLLIATVVGILLAVSVSGCNSSQRAADKAYEQGLVLKEQGKFDEARQQFLLALEHVPRHAGAVLELGIVHCSLDDYRQAVKYLLRAIEYGETSPKPYAFLGYAYEQLGRISLAEAAYHQALHKSPRLVDIRLRLADILEMQGKYQDAAESLNQALTLQPDIEQAEYLQARAMLLQEPERADFYAALADLYIRHGQIERGLAAYQQAFVWDLQNPETLVDVGLFCLERDQFVTAATYLERAKEAGRTQQIAVRVGLGLSYEALDKPQEAVAEFRAALQLDPTWYVLYVKLSQLLEELGQNEKAAQELETLFYMSDYASALDESDWFADVNTLWAEILRLRGEDSAKTVVQLTPSGQFWSVQATLNQQVPAVLHIEQRATYTILSVQLAQALGIQITSRTSEMRFELGGQTYSAPLVNLPSLTIGGIEVRNIPTLIWNLSDYPGVDGFLGMSFLKHFQVEIKEQERLLVLTKTYS